METSKKIFNHTYSTINQKCIPFNLKQTSNAVIFTDKTSFH